MFLIFYEINRLTSAKIKEQYNSKVILLFCIRKGFASVFAAKPLFYFLLQATEQLVIEKIVYRNAQPVANFFDGGNGSAVVPSADDVVKGRLGNTTEGRKLVYGYLF